MPSMCASFRLRIRMWRAFEYYEYNMVLRVRCRDDNGFQLHSPKGGIGKYGGRPPWTNKMDI